MEWFSRIFSTDVLYFELAHVPGDEAETQPFMRLCLALEKRFPNIRGWQLILDICDIATKNENCFFTFRDTWLKTTVTLKNPDSLSRRALSEGALREMIRSPGVDDHSRTRYWMQLLRRLALPTAEVAKDKEPQIAIRRNVLPRQRYWMKLLEFHRNPHLTSWDFYTRRILDKSLCEGKSLQEIRRHSKCALATSLRPARRRRLKKVPAESASVTTSPEAAAGVVVLPEVHPGDIFLLTHIKSGAEGSVWKVVWNNCTYALKSYESWLAAKFDIDHQIATMRPVSQHPHIVQTFRRSRNVNLKDDSCLLMEFLDGTLPRFMYEAHRLETLPSRLDELDVLLQIASAMKRLHENKVVHGDLKPENILLEAFKVSGDVHHFLAKVADFGSAKIINPHSDFVPSRGTKEYASPEVLMMRPSVMEKLEADGVPKPKKLDVPAKSDVYSFGVMAYEILTGCKPFSKDMKLKTADEIYNVATGETKLIDSKEWKTVTRLGLYIEVVSLVEKCLELDPKKRPTFSEVCATLRRCARSNLQAEERRVPKPKWSMSSVTAVLLVLVIFLFYPSCTMLFIIDLALSMRF